MRRCREIYITVAAGPYLRCCQMRCAGMHGGNMATLAARASAGLGAMKNPVNILTINMTFSIGFVLFNSTLSLKDTLTDTF